MVPLASITQIKIINNQNPWSRWWHTLPGLRLEKKERWGKNKSEIVFALLWLSTESVTYQPQITQWWKGNPSSWNLSHREAWLHLGKNTGPSARCWQVIRAQLWIQNCHAMPCAAKATRPWAAWGGTPPFGMVRLGELLQESLQH